MFGYSSNKHRARICFMCCLPACVMYVIFSKTKKEVLPQLCTHSSRLTKVKMYVNMPFPQLSHLVLHKKLTTENENEDFRICQIHNTYEKNNARARDHTFCSMTNCDMHAWARDNTFCSITHSRQHIDAQSLNHTCAGERQHILLNHSISQPFYTITQSLALSL